MANFRLRDVQVPSFDGKLVIAAIFVLGYFILILRIADRTLPDGNINLIRDALLVLGPAIGVIVGALFRTTAADERQSAIASEDLRTAIVTPSGPAAAPAATQEAVRTGAREGVSEGLEQSLDGPVLSTGIAAGDYSGSDVNFTAPRHPAPGVYGAAPVTEVLE